MNAAHDVAPRARHWLAALLIALTLLTFARGAALVLHRPLIALANNYDQVRYSSCFDLAPVRPGIPADRFNPQAPLRLFAFHDGFPSGICVWTSDVLFTAPVAFAWRFAEALGSTPEHSIGDLGVLRLFVWCGVIAWLLRAWWRCARPDIAFALVVCTGAVFFDPAITLLFNTWYAEPAAAFGLYLCCVGALLLTQTRQHVIWIAAAFGAAMLAASKTQHAILPLLLAVSCLATGKRGARASASALLVGGIIGAVLSVAGASRAASHGMELANRGNFVLMVLLPNSAHPAETAASIGLSAACAERAGPHGVWALEQPLAETCPGLADVSSVRAWVALVSEPAALLRALHEIPQWLTPWVSHDLGLVEGHDYARLPGSQWSLDRLLGDDMGLALGLLVLPWLMLCGVLLLPTQPVTRVCAAMCAVIALEVPVVSMFGDGYSDLAKHSQLSIAAALACLSIPLAGMARFALRTLGGLTLGPAAIARSPAPPSPFRMSR
jgi:hypothetical protein